MNLQFVQRFAPELALMDASALSGGLEEPQPYDAQGNPLPWLQERGGQRQYFGTPGTDGLRGRLPAGITEPEQIVPDPFGPRRPDEPATPAYFGGLQQRLPTAGGLRGRLPVTPENAEVPQNILAPHGRRGNTARIPAMSVEDQVLAGANAERVGNDVADAAMYDRVLHNLQNPQQMSLGDMLSAFNFSLPNLGRTADGLRGRFDRAEEPTQPNPSATLNTGQRFNVSTAEGLAEFNRRMGMNLGNQVRTQAEQDSLFRRGLTPTRNSRHLTGEAVDIRPRDIGGLTGQVAVAEVNRRLQAAGYTGMYVQWESGHGRNQGTGAHVHVQPSRR